MGVPSASLEGVEYLDVKQGNHNSGNVGSQLNLKVWKVSFKRFC